MTGQGGTVLNVLHGGHRNGATSALMRCVGSLRDEHGWQPAFWIPNTGEEVAAALRITPLVWARGRPIEFGLAGMSEPPGLLARLAATPSYLRDFARTLRALSPDVVHANTLYASPEAFVARAMGFPTVLHVHETLDSSPKRRALAAAISHAGDVMVAVSEATAAPLVAAVGGRSEVRVVHNGVTPAHVPGGRVPGAPPVIGTVGTISRRKGTDVFVAMVDRLAASRPDLRFEVLGVDGGGKDEEFARTVRAAARGHVESGRLTITYTDDVAGRLAGWTAFVLPTRDDPFPLAVLEAMSAGLPVVASRVGGLPEQVADGETGMLVDPGDAEVLADAVAALVDDEERAARMGAAGAARVASGFTLDAQSAALAGAYERARELRGAARPAAAPPLPDEVRPGRLPAATSGAGMSR